MTVSSDHPIKLAGIKKLRKAFRECCFKLIFVTTPDNYQYFKRQPWYRVKDVPVDTIDTTKGMKGKRKRVEQVDPEPNYAKSINQYVIMIPWTENAAC